MVDKKAIATAGVSMSSNTQQKSNLLSKTNGAGKIETLNLAVSEDDMNQRNVVPHRRRKGDARRTPATFQSYTNSNLKHSEGDISYPSSIQHRQGHEPSRRPSTDYSDEWVHGLPSLTEVLEQDNQKRQTGEDNPSHRRRSVIAVPSTEGAIQEVEKGCPSMQEADFPETRNDASEVENALFGLEDSIAMRQGQPLDSLSNHTLEAQDPVSFQVQSGNLFFSTDSPGKGTPPTLKRGASCLEHTVSPQKAPFSKRPKLGETVEEASFLSRKDGDMIGPPVVKPGLPAWVYDFDPAFVAEYQDFVEFV